MEYALERMCIVVEYVEMESKQLMSSVCEYLSYCPSSFSFAATWQQKRRKKDNNSYHKKATMDYKMCVALRFVSWFLIPHSVVLQQVPVMLLSTAPMVLQDGVLRINSIRIPRNAILHKHLVNMQHIVLDLLYLVLPIPYFPMAHHVIIAILVIKRCLAVMMYAQVSMCIVKECVEMASLHNKSNVTLEPTMDSLGTVAHPSVPCCSQEQCVVLCRECVINLKHVMGIRVNVLWTPNFLEQCANQQLVHVIHHSINKNIQSFTGRNCLRQFLPVKDCIFLFNLLQFSDIALEHRIIVLLMFLHLIILHVSMVIHAPSTMNATMEPVLV